MNETLWILVIAVAAILVIGFRLLGRQRAVGGRTPIDLEDMHRGFSHQVSLSTFSQVFTALGEAYSVDPRLIRPEDSLNKLLDMDSWLLDAGTEKLNRWLNSIGIDQKAARPSTVLDLLLLVESRPGPHQNTATAS